MILLLVGAINLSTALFLSDEKKEVDVVCPVDGTKFKAFEVVVSNHWGGRDMDFCPHAYKSTPLEYWVWVCPRCSFAGRKKDFDLKLTDDEKKALAAELKPAIEIKKAAKQTDIPGHVKYDLLAQVARIRKLAAEQQGVAWLHAAWSCRQQGAVDFADFVEWDKLEESYGLQQTPMQLGFKKNRTEFELDAAKKVEKDIDAKKYERGVNRLLARYLAAFLFRKHGENAEASHWLIEVEKLKGENSIVDDAAAKMHASIELERAYQKKAIDVFAEVVNGGKLEKHAAWEITYQLGELFRRTGNATSAASWYRTAVENAPTDDLKKLATDQKAKVEK
jgi:hypothetical protein